MTVFSGHLPGGREYRRLLAGLFFAGIATFAQLYAPQAVLPKLSDQLGADPSTAALAVSAATLGLAGAVIPWSVAADRIGRVPAMVCGVVIATACGGLALLASDISLLLILRLCEGVALGAVPAVALAYLSEEVNPGHVASAAGSYIAGTTVGGLTGRIVAGPVGELVGWRGGVASALLVCAVAATLFVLLVPRARGFVPGRQRIVPGPSPSARVRMNLRSSAQWALYTQGFLLMGAFVAVYNYLGFHLSAAPFLLPASVVTLLFLAYLAGTLSSPRAGALAVRHGRLPVLIVAIVVTGVGAVGLLSSNVVVVVGGLLVFTAGFFGAHAVASGWTPVAAHPEARAQASSLYYLGYYGGSSLFGWALGLVFGAAGWVWFIVSVSAMCVLSAVIAVVALRRMPPHAR